MRSALAAALALAPIAVLAPACAHSEDTGQPTTLTSAAPPPEPDIRPEVRLADALCQREASCGRINRNGRYPSTETCQQDLSTRMGRELAEWKCSPAASRARFEECLASVRSELCQTIIDRADRLQACRPNVVCGI